MSGCQRAGANPIMAHNRGASVSMPARRKGVEKRGRESFLDGLSRWLVKNGACLVVLVWLLVILPRN